MLRVTKYEFMLTDANMLTFYKHINIIISHVSIHAVLSSQHEILSTNFTPPVISSSYSHI